MGRRTTVSIEGLAELRRRLDEVPDEIKDGAREAVNEGAEDVRDYVKDNIRVDTGRARDAIRVRHVGGAGLSADVGWFDDDLYYVQYIEFGTSSIEADPVLTVATEIERERFAARVSDEVRRELGG